MIDNHIITQAEKEREKGDRCSCGGSWDEIDWCADYSCPCNGDCGDKHGFVCAKLETRLECQECGLVCESE